VAPVEATFACPNGGVRAWLKELRLHQWAKNMLIFAPIALAGPQAAPGDLLKAAIGFFVFGLLASVGYVINDLLDLAADREQDNKRLRPFAAGLLTPKAGLVGGAVLLTMASAAAVMLEPAFAFAAFSYFVGTVSYSLKLKRIPMLDVLVLAGLFTVRVVAGTTLTEASFSYWLITFSVFIFLSLALLKRYAELLDEPPGDSAMLESRGYSAVDLSLLLPFGAGSAVAAGLIFVVYLVEERFSSDIYTQPQLLWLIFPVLLLWLMHMWRVAVHGDMHEDPVLFALKDRTSLLLGAIAAAMVFLAR
jgi:4-hydroxybenzoate polyprenyltransferase